MKVYDPDWGRIIGRIVFNGTIIENRHLVYPVKSGNLAILYCEDNQCLKIYKRFNPVIIGRFVVVIPNINLLYFFNITISKNILYLQ